MNSSRRAAAAVTALGVLTAGPLLAHAQQLDPPAAGAPGEDTPEQKLQKEVDALVRDLTPIQEGDDYKALAAEVQKQTVATALDEAAKTLSGVRAVRSGAQLFLAERDKVLTIADPIQRLSAWKLLLTAERTAKRTEGVVAALGSLDKLHLGADDSAAPAKALSEQVVRLAGTIDGLAPQIELVRTAQAGVDKGSDAYKSSVNALDAAEKIKATYNAAGAVVDRAGVLAKQAADELKQLTEVRGHLTDVAGEKPTVLYSEVVEWALGQAKERAGRFTVPSALEGTPGAPALRDHLPATILSAGKVGGEVSAFRTAWGTFVVAVPPFAEGGEDSVLAALKGFTTRVNEFLAGLPGLLDVLLEDGQGLIVTLGQKEAAFRTALHPQGEPNANAVGNVALSETEARAVQQQGVASVAGLETVSRALSELLAGPERLPDSANQLLPIQQRVPRLGTTQQGLRSAGASLEEALGGDRTGFVVEQVRLFYFSDIRRLMSALNSATDWANPADRVRESQAALARRQLVQAEAQLPEQIQVIGEYQRKVSLLREKLRLAEAERVRAEKRLAAEKARATLLVRQKEDLERQLKPIDDAIEKENKKAADQKNEAFLKEQEDKRADLQKQVAASADRSEAQKRVVEDAQTALQALIDQQTSEQGDLKDAPAQLEAAQTRLTQEQTRIRELRRSIRLLVEDDVQAFAAARDNAPYLYAPPRAASTDPAARVILYGYPDSKTIFIRGTVEDVEAVRNIIATFDRPAPQARISLYTLQINGPFTKGLNQAIQEVDHTLRDLRSATTLFQSVLRDAVNDEVNRVAFIAQLASPTEAEIASYSEGENLPSLAPYSGRLARALYYPEEMRQAQGFSYHLPRDVELLASLLYDIMMVQRSFREARISHQNSVLLESAHRDDAKAEAERVRTSALHAASFHLETALATFARLKREYPLIVDAHVAQGYAEDFQSMATKVDPSGGPVTTVASWVETILDRERSLRELVLREANSDRFKPDSRAHRKEYGRLLEVEVDAASGKGQGRLLSPVEVEQRAGDTETRDLVKQLAAIAQRSDSSDDQKLVAIRALLGSDQRHQQYVQGLMGKVRGVLDGSGDPAKTLEAVRSLLDSERKPSLRSRTPHASAVAAIDGLVSQLEKLVEHYRLDAIEQNLGRIDTTWARYMTAQEARDAENLTRWTLPDPTNTTTLGETLFVALLGKRESRERILRGFALQVERAFRNVYVPMEDYRRGRALTNGRSGSKKDEIGESYQHAQALVRFRDAVLGNYLPGYGSRDPLGAYPYFLSAVLGNINSQPDGTDPAALTANQKEILTAIQTRTREAVGAEIRHLLYQIDGYQTTPRVLGAKRLDLPLTSPAVMALREQYYPLVGWLQSFLIQEDRTAVEKDLLAYAGPGMTWYAMGKAFVSRSRDLEPKTVADKVREAERARQAVAALQQREGQDSAKDDAALRELQTKVTQATQQVDAKRKELPDRETLKNQLASEFEDLKLKVLDAQEAFFREQRRVFEEKARGFKRTTSGKADLSAAEVRELRRSVAEDPAVKKRRAELISIDADRKRKQEALDRARAENAAAVEEKAKAVKVQQELTTQLAQIQQYIATTQAERARDLANARNREARAAIAVTEDETTIAQMRSQDRVAYTVAELARSRNALSSATGRVAAADDMIKRLIQVTENDLDHFFVAPALEDLQQQIALAPGVTLGTFQKESLLVTNRLVGRIDPVATGSTEVGAQQDFLGAAQQLSNMVADYRTQKRQEQLANTAPLIGATGSLLAGADLAKNILPWTGLAGLLGSLGTVPNDPPGEVYSVTSGNLFQVTPIFDPSGQALRFRFDFSASVDVQEPSGSINRLLPRVEHHTVNTEVQLTNLEFREISSFTTNYRLGQEASRTGGLPLLKEFPLLKDLPIVGYYTRTKSSRAQRQESIIFAHSSLYPTIGDLINLLTDVPARSDLQSSVPGYLLKPDLSNLPEKPEAPAEGGALPTRDAQSDSEKAGAK